MKKLASIATLALCLSLVVGAGTASAQVIPGCFPGNTYSTQNGQACTPASVDTGCGTGNTYSTVTGAACANASVPVTTPGLPNTGVASIVGDIAVALAALALVAGSAVALRKTSTASALA